MVIYVILGTSHTRVHRPERHYLFLAVVYYISFCTYYFLCRLFIDYYENSLLFSLEEKMSEVRC